MYTTLLTNKTALFGIATANRFERQFLKDSFLLCVQKEQISGMRRHVVYR